MNTSQAMITEYFKRTAMDNPAPALRWGKGSVLSWSELYARASRLAQHLLHERDVQPGECIAIGMERGPEFMVAAYAVLLAGAVYFPLDAKTPVARMASMLVTARCRVAFCTEAQSATLLAAEPDLELILREQLSAIDETGQQRLHDRPLPELSAAGPAYLIFTSGSTGAPKGVLVSHGALINRLEWHQHHSGMQADEVILQRTALTFDVSLWELFLPALNGGSHYLLQPGLEAFPRGIVSVLASEKISIMHVVPSLLKPVLQELQEGESVLPALRQVYVSGESLSASLVGQFRQWFGDRCLLTNLYGPTEAAIDVTWYDCKEDGVVAIPIGQPLPSCELFIVDPETRALKGEHEIGEIAIGGICLAEGYYNRPDLTDKAFIVHPALQQRLYLTGDLGWYETGRGFFCQGRKDTQVKLRGLRIELGEIEHHLLNHAGISEAVACVVEDGDGEQWLVAAIAGDSPQDTQLLRQYLATLMPAYMLPARYWQTGKLPRNSSGKLDRKAVATALREHFFAEMAVSA
ncbi:amino acid adenylation domain-containing protein [Parachitinimonas caeni]|uniref:Amino acid adenylation domain-containing protein n=1 Tax=Parachitinimonas caeni TaxID=3031301 RepID=A0ABT7DTS9_9NEIS|nr:amino acid adenylation domain-containing protein [Parachitinimonas caeni]MDK2123465.1 amino acid adenylation domain-containing protein [Parachitinimonas caeni]